jgi:hypothetical protein
LKKSIFSLAGMALLCGVIAGMALPAIARDVTGKVTAVYHEPVVVNNKTLDKVSVSVNNCATGQWETFAYSPGAVSDDNSLGFLFNDLANAARSMATKNQYMNSVSGHVTLAVNEQNMVQRTTFWGYNWECGKDLDAGAPMSPASGAKPSTTAPQTGKPAATPNPLGGLRKFGGF